MAAAQRVQKEPDGKGNHEYLAADAVSGYMNEMVNARDLQEVIETQNGMLQKFEKTNETLTQVNAISEMRYNVISNDFRKHISTLLEMKRNLDSVFKRIRVIKRAVQNKYPEAFEACKVVYVPPDDDDDEEAKTPTGAVEPPSFVAEQEETGQS